MSKSAALTLLPAIMLGVIVLILALPRFESDPSKRQRMEQGIAVIAGAIAVIMFVLHTVLVIYNQGFAVSIDRIIALIVGIFFAAIGNVAPRLPQSSMNLVKLPEPVYKRMSRQIGQLMVISGILIALTAAMPSAWLPGVTIVCILVSSLATAAFSIYHLSKA
ncbi:SdpI family protein [Paenibacillus alkalitolerans]|uniref:hypothetical protein n=1 Tax=Paenibacillus alkalitolerans TaxID=2799335 RepID=UPI0018F2F0A9|nr:hypothetical protein [Paenibacillus alkalitolerans]